MTVKPDHEMVGRPLIITTNTGVQSDENSFCSPQHFEEAHNKKNHKREGSLTGHTVIEGGVQWLTAKRIRQAYELFTSFHSLLNSGVTEAIPDVTLLQQPIKLLQDAIPNREEEQQKELADLLKISVETHDINTIQTCFYLLNVLYVPETDTEGILPHPDTLYYHLSIKGMIGEPPQVTLWLVASCILHEQQYQAICWSYIHKYNLYDHVHSPGNCTIFISESKQGDRNVNDPPPYPITAYKEVLCSLAPELSRVLYSGDKEVTFYGYKPSVVCGVFGFLYEGKIEITPDNLIEVLEFANQYQIQALTVICMQWIEVNLEIFLSYENCIIFTRHFSLLGLENITHLLCFRLISILADCVRNETSICHAHFVQTISPLLIDVGQVISTFDVHCLLNHASMSRHINPEDVDESFIDITTRYCPRLKTIDISRIPGVSDKSLLHILTRCKFLESLNVSSCQNITPKGFTNAFRKCKASLISLNLSSCNIKDGACLNKMNENLLNLENLHLDHCSKLSEKEAVLLFDRLMGLRKVYLKGCKKISDKVLFKMSERCANIRELSLSGCINVTDKGLNEVVSNLRSLTVLSIKGCKKITDSPCYIVAKQLTEPTTLYLSDTGVTDRGVSTMTLKLANLRVLNVSGTEATGVSLISISRSPSIKSIGMSNCQDVRDEHLIELANNNPHINELFLEGCDLLTDNGLHQLLYNCKSLRVLSISGCTRVSKVMIQMIPSEIPGLEELHVKGCRDEVILQARQIQRDQMPHISVFS